MVLGASITPCIAMYLFNSVEEPCDVSVTVYDMRVSSQQSRSGLA